MINKSKPPSIKTLWKELEIEPNQKQEEAILHTDGPLFITAGPGCGKTTVLLWRTLNLLVYHSIKPEEIYLGTFTEKAAKQLIDGLLSLLGFVTNRTGVYYDISQMYIGTIHSTCRKILADRRFAPSGSRNRMPILMDELSQYFYIYDKKFWTQMIEAAGIDADEAIGIINEHLDNGWYSSRSKHTAVSNCISFFNRLSEECIEPASILSKMSGKGNEIPYGLIRMYDFYLNSMQTNRVKKTDLSILQQRAFEVLSAVKTGKSIFKHIIIDEYQDTNSVQEKIFFSLAKESANICVVGDDDQSLYRFRGATVENFVDYKDRCRKYLKVPPHQINLKMNYRSRSTIVDFYKRFVLGIDWKKEGRKGHYRVMDKELVSHRRDPSPAVVSSTPGKPDEVYTEIAQLIRKLIDSKKVEDPNQIAFLFPSLKSKQVDRAKEALAREELEVYAPRAGRFLEVQESLELFGLFLLIFGRPPRHEESYGDLLDFYDWQESAIEVANSLVKEDKLLKRFVHDKKDEITEIIKDFDLLSGISEKNKWNLDDPYSIPTMKRTLSEVSGLSSRAKRNIVSGRFEKSVERRLAEGKPYTLRYILTRATSLDWNLLDLFYQLMGFGHFIEMFHMAEKGKDEGPICNLGLITQYISRYQEEYSSLITGRLVRDYKLHNSLFNLYLYAIFKRGESEYEDADDPFPKGRIPFLTVHQAKGLEFPVVVLANPRKDNKGPQKNEILLRQLVERHGEPLEKVVEYDTARMFYVALSRAENLLVIAHLRGQGQRLNVPFPELLADIPKIPEIDIDSIPMHSREEKNLGNVYSYTGDYLTYNRCPRNYMVFRKYGFAPSRTQTMMFGNLIHQTIEDLHYRLIFNRAQL